MNTAKKHDTTNKYIHLLGSKVVRSPRIVTDEFPLIVKEDFRGLYEQFISTRLCEGVINLSKQKAQSVLNVAIAFMSYTSNYTSQLYVKPFNLQKISSMYILSLLKLTLPEIQDKLKRYNIAQEFTLHHVDVNLNPKSYNKDLNIEFNFEPEVQLCFRLKHKRSIVREPETGMRYKQNNVLAAFHRIKPYMFKRGDIPPMLLPKNYKKFDKYPLESDVRKKATSRFAEIDDNVFAHISGRDSFILRFRLRDFHDVVLAYGRESRMLRNKVEAAASKLFIGV